MALKILVKRGLEADLSKAGTVAGELKFTTDTKKLFIGTGDQNVEIGGSSVWGAIGGDIEDQEDLIELLSDKVDKTRTINNKALTTDIVLKTSDLQNDSNFATTTQVNATGHKLSLAMDSTTYVLTVKLLDNSDNVLDTKTVDLPLEEIVVSGSYDAATKKIVLTLKSGDTIDIPVSDMLSGIVNSSRKVGSNDLSADITAAQLLNDIKDVTGEFKNKTFNVDNNSLSNVAVSNFKTGVVKTAFGETPSDEALVSEKLAYDSLAGKQPKSDSSLETTSKNVVGAINELNAWKTSGSMDGGTF